MNGSGEQRHPFSQLPILKSSSEKLNQFAFFRSLCAISNEKEKNFGKRGMFYSHNTTVAKRKQAL